jgi:hypothetical protein
MYNVNLCDVYKRVIYKALQFNNMDILKYCEKYLQPGDDICVKTVGPRQHPDVIQWAMMHAGTA